MKFTDLALGERHDGHVGETKVLEQGGDVCLVTADPVKRLGEDYVEFAALGVLEQCLNVGPQDYTGAGDGRILVSADDPPILALGLFTTNSKLILDRRVTLQVVGIAGIGVISLSDKGRLAAP
jgi:hypothetical protein